MLQNVTSNINDSDVLYIISLGMENLITSTKAAKMLGMSKQAFYSAVKSGRFTVAARNEHGHPLFDPSVVKKEHTATREVAQLQNHARGLPPPLQGGRPPVKPKDDTKDGAKGGSENRESAELQKGFLKIKLKREVVETGRQELKLKIESGQYIDKTEAKRQGEEVGQIIMGTLEALPSRLAPELAAMKDADSHDIQLFLERELNALIIAIKDKCEGKPKEEGT